MACKLTYKGKQYDSEIALRYDVLKDKGLLDRYNALYESYTSDVDETFTQAKQILDTLLPDDVFTITDKNVLMDKVVNNGITFGYLHDKIIYLASNAPIGTAYHEAFHAVFRTFLTDEQISGYLDKAKEQYGKPTKQQLSKLREQTSAYGQLSDVQLEQIFYEEQMAEQFTEYMQNKRPKTVFGRLFAKLKRFIQFFTAPDNNIDILFEDIALGKFKTAKPVHSIFRKSPVFSLLTNFNNNTTAVQASDVRQIYSKVALLGLKNRKEKLTSEDVRAYLEEVKNQFRISTWTEELNKIDKSKADVIKKRLIGAYNAISINDKYDTMEGGVIQVLTNKPADFDANVEFIKDRANKMLDLYSVDQSEDPDVNEDNIEQIRSEQRQTKGSIYKIGEFVRHYIHSISMPKDHFGFGLKLTNDNKHLFTVDGTIVFNTLRRNLESVPKDKILSLLLTTEFNSKDVNVFKERLANDLLVDLHKAGYKFTKSDLVKNDPAVTKALFNSSGIFNAIIAAFNQSKDSYISVLKDVDKYIVTNSNIISASDSTLFKWRQMSISKNQNTKDVSKVVAELGDMFNFGTIKDYIEESTARFEELVANAYGAFQSIGLDISKEYIRNEIIRNYLEKVETPKISEQLLTKYKNRASKSGVSSGKGYKEFRLQDITIENKDNFLYNFNSALKELSPTYKNPIAYIIDNKTTRLDQLALANMIYDETFTNESIIVDGKNIFSINPPNFFTELYATLTSPTMQEAIRLINSNQLGDARELFDVMFGKSSPYKYDEYYINKLFNAYSNNMFIRGIEGYEDLQRVLPQLSQYVLYEIADAGKSGTNQEFSKATKYSKLVTKLGLFSQESNYRQFIPQVLSDKTINRTVEFPVFDITNVELVKLFKTAMLREMEIEYNRIQQELEYFSNLGDTLSADHVLLRNYNYIEEDGISYIYTDQGFMQLEKKYDKYGVYQGASLIKSEPKDLSKFRAFNMFNYKGLDKYAQSKRPFPTDVAEGMIDKMVVKMTNDLRDQMIKTGLAKPLNYELKEC